MGKEEKAYRLCVQLMAKQKLKGYYGNIGEKQFRKYLLRQKEEEVTQVRI